MRKMEQMREKMIQPSANRSAAISTLNFTMETLSKQKI